VRVTGTDEAHVETRGLRRVRSDDRVGGAADFLRRRLGDRVT